MTMADRVAMMSQGRVAQVGTASDLYERPVSKEVARFVGTINLFSGTVMEAGPLVTVDAGSAGRIMVPVGNANVRRGQTVDVAVRPEKMIIGDKAPDAGSNGLRARLASASYVGDRTYYHLDGGSAASKIAVVRLNEAPVSGAFEAGGEAWVTWPHHSGILLSA